MEGIVPKENALAKGTEVCYLSLKQNIKYMVSRSLVLEHLNFDPFVYSSNIEDCSPMIDPPKSSIEVDLLLYVYNLLCSIYQSQLNWFVFNELYWSTPIHG